MYGIRSTDCREIFDLTVSEVRLLVLVVNLLSVVLSVFEVQL